MTSISSITQQFQSPQARLQSELPVGGLGGHRSSSSDQSALSSALTARSASSGRRTSMWNAIPIG